MSQRELHSQLPWTGERMVPCASDGATELFHWQRYLYFKPWYENSKVIDAASGEGYGTSFAAFSANCAKGIDLSDEAVAHANSRYPNASFTQGDVCTADYSDADFVVSFETIEHVPDPVSFLKALNTCQGRIVISTPNRKTHSPGNGLNDKPRNEFHTIEWTPLEFADLIRDQFPNRQVRFLSQSGQWPGLISEGLDDEAMYCIAVIGDGELPNWPKIGLSMPTRNNSKQAIEAAMSLSKYYPGELEFEIVANNAAPEHISRLEQFQAEMPHLVRLTVDDRPLGYGRASNFGVKALMDRGNYDLIGVTNDDVLSTTFTMVELVSGWNALVEARVNPGIIGPVSNSVSGAQQIVLGEYSDYNELIFRSEQHYALQNSSVSQVIQVRGLFFLCPIEVWEALGGFDPRFGLGNFEDDDLNLRLKLAGYSLWVADGAVLFHHGSQSFQQDGASAYTALMDRNAEVFKWKWDLMEVDYWPSIDEVPAGVDLFVPLDATWENEFSVTIDGTTIDLINQASDIEFVKWVYDRMKHRYRSTRRDLVKLLLNSAPASAVVEPLETKNSTAA